MSEPRRPATPTGVEFLRVLACKASRSRDPELMRLVGELEGALLALRRDNVRLRTKIRDLEGQIQFLVHFSADGEGDRTSPSSS